MSAVFNAPVRNYPKVKQIAHLDMANVMLLRTLQRDLVTSCLEPYWKDEPKSELGFAFEQQVCGVDSILYQARHADSASWPVAIRCGAGCRHSLQRDDVFPVQSELGGVSDHAVAFTQAESAHETRQPRSVRPAVAGGRLRDPCECGRFQETILVEFLEQPVRQVQPPELQIQRRHAHQHFQPVFAIKGFKASLWKRGRHVDA